jgi:3-hydroxybutyryl-CoA dehydrogenase
MDRALSRIRESLARFVAHGLVPAPEVEGIVGRIRSSTSLDDAAGADLVVEAVPEDQALKHAVFEHLDRVCPPPAVLALEPAGPTTRPRRAPERARRPPVSAR